MKKNHLTLVIQPACSIRSIASFSFHKRAISWFYLCLILTVAFAAYGSWEIYKNKTLRQDIAALQESLLELGPLEQKIQTMRGSERMMRTFLGIQAGDEKLDVEERLGMGGTDVEDAADMESFDPLVELESLADTRPLHEQAYSLREDLVELNAMLVQMTETLRLRPTIMPVQDDHIWLTSGFGWRKSPFTGLRTFHSGLDISGRRGAPIIATADGVVTKASFDRLLGNYVRIAHDERFQTMYAHMLKLKVKKGDKVQRGQVIGLMGSTGRSTGYHVHYEVRDNSKKMNPYNFILNREALNTGTSRG
jgi:hypothetical protein